MSTRLLTTKQKAFVKLLHIGLPITRAYERAGYRPNRWNCWTAAQSPNVQRELRRLEARALRKHDVTVEKVLTDLQRAMTLAEQEKQAGAMINAAMSQAKVCGLITDKIEQRDISKMDMDEIVKTMREEFGDKADAILQTLEVDTEDKPDWEDFPTEGTVQ